MIVSPGRGRTLCKLVHCEPWPSQMNPMRNVWRRVGRPSWDAASQHANDSGLCTLSLLPLLRLFSLCKCDMHNCCLAVSSAALFFNQKKTFACYKPNIARWENGHTLQYKVFCPCFLWMPNSWFVSYCLHSKCLPAVSIISPLFFLMFYRNRDASSFDDKSHESNL